MTLEELKAAIEAVSGNGWTVRIVDHGYGNDGRNDVPVEVVPGGLILRPRSPWSSQGRGFPTMKLDWSDDLEVEEESVFNRFRRADTVVHRFYIPTGTTSRTRAGVREASHTFVFSSPRGY